MSDDKDSSHGSRPPGRLPRGVATPVPPDVADNPASDAQPLFPDLAAEDLGLDEFQEPGSEDIPTSLLVNIQHPSDSSSAYPLAEEDLESLRPGDGIPEDNQEFIPTIPPGAHRGSAHTGQAPAAAGASPRGLFSSEAAPVGPGAGLEAPGTMAGQPVGHPGRKSTAAIAVPPPPPPDGGQVVLVPRSRVSSAPPPPPTADELQLPESASDREGPGEMDETTVPFDDMTTRAYDDLSSELRDPAESGIARVDVLRGEAPAASVGAGSAPGRADEAVLVRPDQEPAGPQYSLRAGREPSPDRSAPDPGGVSSTEAIPTLPPELLGRPLPSGPPSIPPAARAPAPVDVASSGAFGSAAAATGVSLPAASDSEAARERAASLSEAAPGLFKPPDGLEDTPTPQPGERPSQRPVQTAPVSAPPSSESVPAPTVQPVQPSRRPPGLSRHAMALFAGMVFFSIYFVLVGDGSTPTAPGVASPGDASPGAPASSDRERTQRLIEGLAEGSVSPSSLEQGEPLVGVHDQRRSAASAAAPQSPRPSAAAPPRPAPSAAPPRPAPSAAPPRPAPSAAPASAVPASAVPAPPGPAPSGSPAVSAAAPPSPAPSAAASRGKPAAAERGALEQTPPVPEKPLPANPREASSQLVSEARRYPATSPMRGRLLRRAVGVDGRNARAVAALCEYELGVGRLEAAEQWGARSVKLRSRRVAYRTLYAEVLLRAGKRRKALVQIQRALELDRRDEGARELMRKLGSGAR